MRRLWLACVCVAVASAPGQARAEHSASKLDADACVERALRNSTHVEHARALLSQQQTRASQVDAHRFPRLTATSFLAPAYTVRGSGFDPNVTIRYKSLKDWGPFTNFEARVVQGLYSFGRFDAAKEAARERTLVERGRVRQTEQEVAREVRRLYFQHLFVKTMRPALEHARGIVDQAVERATASLERASGEVRQGDLGRLEHGRGELMRRLAQAEEAEVLSLEALSMWMGEPGSAALSLQDERLPMPPALLDAERPAPPAVGPANTSLSAHLRLADSDRPEWEQLLHGQRAALALERSERASTLPQLAVVGLFNAAWTPTRDRDRSPWHFDMYNRLAGGAALVLQLDLDVAGARARAQEAAAMGAQLRALQRQAAIGLPLEVRKAHEGMLRARKDLAVGANDVAATRRWFKFATAALMSNTGEARDMLEALVAHLQAKEGHANAALQWWLATTDLAHATGARRLPLVATPAPAG